MGIKLYVEVLDHAPAELTSNERLLLLVLAEKANDQTRKAVWPNPDRLLHRLGMSEDGLRKVCQKLAARGYEVRIPVGTNKAGSPVYAYKGRAVDYRVPVFPRRELPPERRDNSTALGVAKAGQLSVKAGQLSAKGGTVVRKGGTDVPPLPSVPSEVPHLPQRARDEVDRLATDTSATREEIETLIEQIKSERPNIDRPAAYLATLHRNGDLDSRLATIRATHRRTAERDAIRQCRLCDGDGARFQPGTRIPATPYIRCNHQPEQEIA
ncbi:helix-turn-helix domain-containing protein [Saccharomonospora azurea]